MTELNTAKRKEWPMSYVRACMAFGNGDVGRGRELDFKMAEWLEMARIKHQWPRDAEGPYQALWALLEEVKELTEAVEKDPRQWRWVSELLDVIAVACRMLDGEHLTGKERNEWLKMVADVHPTPPKGKYDLIME